MINYPRHLIRRFAPDCGHEPPGRARHWLGQVAERNEILRRLHSLLEFDERRPRGPITLPKLKPLER